MTLDCAIITSTPSVFPDDRVLRRLCFHVARTAADDTIHIVSQRTAWATLQATYMDLDL